MAYINRFGHKSRINIRISQSYLNHYMLIPKRDGMKWH